MPESIATIAELGIGLAGFSGIVVALGYRAGGLTHLDRLRVVILLMASLGAALLATFPQVVSDAGAAASTVWRVSSLLFASVLATFFAWAIMALRSSGDDVRPFLHPLMYALSLGGPPVFALLLLWNGAGWHGEPSAAPYVSSLYYLLLTACVQFVRLLLVRPSDSPAA